MSKNTEASEAINETYKYCSGKIFHLREYVNFNFSFFQALVAPKYGTYVSFTLSRHAKTPNFGAYIISARQRYELSSMVLCPINTTSSSPYVFRLHYPRVLHCRIVPIQKIENIICT